MAVSFWEVANAGTFKTLTLASWAFSLNDSGVMVGGRAFSGMSTQVVTPPAAAACDPVLNPANIGPRIVMVPARWRCKLACLYQPPPAASSRRLKSMLPVFLPGDVDPF